jgi:hypothetical protein
VPVTGALLLATAASAEQTAQTYLDTTNRVTLSLRFGFDINGRFKGVGSTFAPGAPLANTRFTPHGDKYNYDDGYAYADKSGSKDGYTSYWGYDSANQIGASGANSIDFHRTDAVGLPGNRSSDDSPYMGAELTYDYEVGRDDWRHLFYGVEAAANFMPVSFGGTSSYNLSLTAVTDTYGYTAGTTPPSGNLPYQGSFEGPGFLLNYPRTGHATQIGSATFLVQQDFDGNLWGFRLGPYVEYMPSEKWSLHLSGGLAVGIMQASASWKETVTLPGGGPGSSTSVSGHGDDVGLLGGFYLGADAQYKFNDRWSVDAGLQFQDIGTYSHNFGGRVADVDLSKSLFFNAGVSYSF